MTEAKKILVTGGAGFIGSHLVDRLIEEGHQVVIADNLSTGKLRNINPSATFHHTDITLQSIREVFHREQPEIVFHLAAQTSVIESIRDPFKDCQINVTGTLRLLEACKIYGIDRFIYSSTGGALYGDPDVIPCTETTPIIPLCPYGLSKHMGEQYIELFYRLNHLNYTILRYANVYGPRQDPSGESGVIAIFSQLMLQGKNLKIFGDGLQERDFIYVSDVVNANVKAMSSSTQDAFNIGTGRPITINFIYETLQNIIEYSGQVEYHPQRAGEILRISLECEKASKILGWLPSVEIRDGLEKTVEFFRRRIR